MRRHDKEITDREEILSIIRSASVCRLAMCDGDRPYIVPMCFGFDGRTLYFHSAAEGRKLELIRRNPNVCFEFDIDSEIVPAETSCAIGMRYRSVIGHGVASIVEHADGKRHGLDHIVRQYAAEPTGYPEAAVAKTVVIRVEIESLTGKKSGY